MYIHYRGPEDRRVTSADFPSWDGEDFSYEWDTGFGGVAAVHEDHLELVLSVPLMEEADEVQIETHQVFVRHLQQLEKDARYREERARRDSIASDIPIKQDEPEESEESPVLGDSDDDSGDKPEVSRSK